MPIVTEEPVPVVAEELVPVVVEEWVPIVDEEPVSMDATPATTDTTTTPEPSISWIAWHYIDAEAGQPVCCMSPTQNGKRYKAFYPWRAAQCQSGRAMISKLIKMPALAIERITQKFVQLVYANMPARCNQSRRYLNHGGPMTLEEYLSYATYSNALKKAVPESGLVQVLYIALFEFFEMILSEKCPAGDLCCLINPPVAKKESKKRSRPAMGASKA